MTEICVVHLVWDKLSIDIFKSFITSYKKYSSGINHKLLIIFQGNFSYQINNYLNLLNNINYDSYLRKDSGYDIGAYLSIVKNYNYKYFLFLNSYSKLLDHDWLLKMNQYTGPNVGVVGATGSYESPYSQAQLVIPRKKPLIRKAISGVWKKYLVYRLSLHFNPFPNYHIRTNAFLISRELFHDIGKKYFSFSKFRTLIFESGRSGLSNQILKRGLKLLIVGKNGAAYEKEDWYKCGIYRQGNQDNLLISDNRTDDYQYSDIDRRMLLCQAAWGDMTSIY